MSDILEHYGTPRHSGRYPWGSGENPYQRYKSFHSHVTDLKKKGMSEKEIAESLGISVNKLRARMSVASDEIRKNDIAMALKLKAKGYSNVAIGERMGVNESVVRSWLNPDVQERADKTKATAKALKEAVGTDQYIDVGTGTELYLPGNISRTKMQTAIAMLEDEGYAVHNVKVRQLGTGNMTTVQVLAPPGTTAEDIRLNKDKIHPMTDTFTIDGGLTWKKVQPPTSVDSSRVMVRYADDPVSGEERDGLIELRRGVDDISLGRARYAQVRIAVDGTHYLKGMAVYSDDMPDGVDIIFNTNKTRKQAPNKLDAMKPMKVDSEGKLVDNPFGATIKDQEALRLFQREYTDANGETKLSPVNVVNEEGDWSRWSKNLASQMLSKQPVALAKQQLALAYSSKEDEFNDICALTNPAIKTKLLQSFADSCDSASVHLKAAALPGQQTHVILPSPDIKENEIYATNYKNGEKLVLIRYPHGGTFEIPTLTVNNNNKSGRSILGTDSPDAVVINSKVAQQLSGADFDGDTVIAIPVRGQNIKTSAYLDGLKDFNPKTAYPAYDGMQRISVKTKNMKMGDVSNLITDMTIKGASPDEICRAVRHSMVVIDSEKHNLDWRKSYVDHGIAELKAKYQGRNPETNRLNGASTLISKASGPQTIDERKPVYSTKNMTPDQYKDYTEGRKVYTPTNRTYIDRGGRVVRAKQTSTKMAETRNAFDLSSGTPMENVYASHANRLKALANEARKEILATHPIKRNPSAAKVYSQEVSSLNAKLKEALKNAPKERQAQILANYEVKVRIQDNPDLDDDDKKKIRGQALTKAREKVGAKKAMVEITDREWEAIQSGAVSNNVLTQILNNTDVDKLKERATPRQNKGLTSSKVSLAKAKIKAGYTLAEVAESLGVSPSTLQRALEG